MSVELIKQLTDAAKDAEVVGGQVIATIDGKKVRLGGPEGESNTFGLTEEGRAVLEEARKPKKVKPKKEVKVEEDAPAGDAGDLDLDV